MPPSRTGLLPRLAAATVGGVGVGCGFAPVESPWLALVGLAIFIASLLHVSPRSGALLGAAYGVGFLTVLVWWVHVLGAGVLVTLVVVQVPYFVLFGLLFALVTTDGRLWPLWGALVWTAVEFVRSILPFGGFPWGRLAFATVGTPLESYARWVGVAVLSGLVFLLAALVVAALDRRTVRSAVVCGAGVVAIVAAGVALPTGLAGAGEDLEVAIVQGDVPGTGATGMGQQREVLDNHVSETLALADQVADGERPRPDIVLWPENASDIDPIHDEAAGAAISAAARAVGAPILVGAIMDGPTDDTARNEGIVWDPETGPGDRYVKRHLVPYGEYVPFRPLAERLVPMISTEIPRDMVPGSSPGVLDIGPTTVGDMMCFDVVFDNLARDVVMGGAELLVVQTNNATYTGTSQPEQQWQIAQMRAIEAGRYVAVPSTNGISGVVDPRGRVVERAPVDVPATISQTVVAGTEVTTGIRFGRWLEYAAALGAAVLVLAGVARRRKGPRL